MLNRFRCLQARRVGLAPSASKSIAIKLPAFDDAASSVSTTTESSSKAVAAASPGKTGLKLKSSVPLSKAANLAKPKVKSAANSNQSNFKEAANSNQSNFKEATDFAESNCEVNNSMQPVTAPVVSSESGGIKVADKEAAESAKDKVDCDASIEAASESSNLSQSSFASAQQTPEPAAAAAATVRMKESAIGAAITSSQQFDSIFDSAIKAVTSSTTEQLCDNYLKSKPASSAGKLASGLLKGKNANKVMKKAGSAKEEPKQSVSRKRKASSLDASSAAESSLPQPPVNFQFASGTWIECSDCKKWRHEPDCAEPCRVPDNWRCSDSADPRQNDCGLPELAEYFYAQGTNFALSNKYVAGSLVWARVQGYPYWPAIVEVDNDYGTFFELEAESNDVAAYHVTFLGRSASRAWVPDARIRPFEGAEDLAGLSAPKPGSAAELELRRLANEAANVVAKLDFQARLERYGYFAGGRVKLVKKKPADVRDSRSSEKKRNKKKLKTAAKADKTVDNNAKSKKPKKKAKQSKPTTKTAAASGELDDVYTDATAVDDVTDLDAGDEQVDVVEDVDLMAARDRFRRRVSQLCEMRSCGEGEGDAGEAHDAADDDEESAEEAEA